MKIKNLILLTSFLLTGSQVISSQSKTVDLPVIDISKKYQKKDIVLQDIADIEYIPLETTDDVLLGNRPILSCVSDKYILVHETIRGDIFVFDRTGKIISHFNRKGQSGMEYTWIGDGGCVLNPFRFIR
ncbi:MAG: 6-bladed beta-propeller [Dysgonamonadaceae bacterium]|nr:6-bladed beta-propeller [Dysgonamonadaceae bacterium]